MFAQVRGTEAAQVRKSSACDNEGKGSAAEEDWQTSEK